MKPNQITVIFMGLFLIAIVFYDIFALYFMGADSTISCILNQWAFQAHPLMVFCFGFIFGGLIIHFFKWSPKEQKDGND